MKDEFDTLIGLVSHYSPSGDEQKAVLYLLERMRSLGIENTFQDEVGNAIGILGRGPKQIVLLGHIDTVPGEIPVRVEKGILYDAFISGVMLLKYVGEPRMIPSASIIFSRISFKSSLSFEQRQSLLVKHL